MPLLTRTEYVTVFPAAFQAVRKASSPRALGIPTAKGAPQAMELPRDAHGTARLPAINACPGGNAGYSPNDRKWHRRCDSSQGPWGQDTAGLARGHSGAGPGTLRGCPRELSGAAARRDSALQPPPAPPAGQRLPQQSPAPAGSRRDCSCREALPPFSKYPETGPVSDGTDSPGGKRTEATDSRHLCHCWVGVKTRRGRSCCHWARQRMTQSHSLRGAVMDNEIYRGTDFALCPPPITITGQSPVEEVQIHFPLLWVSVRIWLRSSTKPFLPLGGWGGGGTKKPQTPTISSNSNLNN